MCAGCKSASQDFNDKPFGTGSDSSMGDDGIAIKNSTKFEGDSGQSKKFEGLAPEKSVGASQAQYSGRQ